MRVVPLIFNYGTGLMKKDRENPGSTSQLPAIGADTALRSSAAILIGPERAIDERGTSRPRAMEAAYIQVLAIWRKVARSSVVRAVVAHSMHSAVYASNCFADSMPVPIRHFFRTR